MSALQLCLASTMPEARAATLSAERSCNRKTGTHSVPITLMVTQIVPLGRQAVQLCIGARDWAEAG